LTSTVILRSCLPGLGLRGLRPFQQWGHIDPSEIPNSQNHQQSDTANPTSSTTFATTRTATILDIFATSDTTQTHINLLSLSFVSVYASICAKTNTTILLWRDT
jgi:hypothetical protein